MLVKELIDKALEIEQLIWWLQNPTVESFFLRSESTGDDNGSYYVEVENRSYRLTTDSDILDDNLDPDDDYEMNSSVYDYYMHHDFSTSSYYPVNINESHYERIHRPKMTDTEMQERINTILSTVGGVSVTQTLGHITGSNITGLVIGDL